MITSFSSKLWVFFNARPDLYNVNMNIQYSTVMLYSTVSVYQHDGKAGQMGGVTVGLVPSRGHSPYPLRGPS